MGLTVQQGMDIKFFFSNLPQKKKSWNETLQGPSLQWSLAMKLYDIYSYQMEWWRKIKT